MDSLVYAKLRILLRTLTRISPKVVKTKTCQDMLILIFFRGSVFYPQLCTAKCMLYHFAQTSTYLFTVYRFLNHQHPAAGKFTERNFHSTSVKWDEEKILSCPKFPDSITDGKVTWDKAVGDTVDEDDIVCEIETEKIAIPVPSPVAGILKERFVSEGGPVKVGDKLFKISITPSK